MCAIYFHPDVVVLILSHWQVEHRWQLGLPFVDFEGWTSWMLFGLMTCYFQVTWKWYLMLSDLAVYNLPHYNLFTRVVIHPGLVQCWLKTSRYSGSLELLERCCLHLDKADHVWEGIKSLGLANAKITMIEQGRIYMITFWMQHRHWT